MTGNTVFDSNHQDQVLLVMGSGNNDRAFLSPDDYAVSVKTALDYASLNKKKVVALQILFSKLYHWGHTDPIVNGYGRTQFIMHLREEVLKRGIKLKRQLKAKAASCGVSLDVIAVESEDPDAIVLKEAKKKYDAIFIPKETKRVFPLFRKTLCQKLKKKAFKNVIVC